MSFPDKFRLRQVTGMVVVGTRGMLFEVELPSGKAVGEVTGGIVSTCGDGVMTEGWLISIEQEQTTKLTMNNQWVAK
jgi:hypothetical protein